MDGVFQAAVWKPAAVLVWEHVDEAGERRRVRGSRAHVCGGRREEEASVQAHSAQLWYESILIKGAFQVFGELHGHR